MENIEDNKNINKNKQYYLKKNCTDSYTTDLKKAIISFNKNEILGLVGLESWEQIKKINVDEKLYNELKNNLIKDINLELKNLKDNFKRIEKKINLF